MSPSQPPPAGPPQAPAPHLVAPNRRLRWVMHAALLLMGMLMALATWSAWRAERGRATDAELINLTGAQGMLSQRVALLAGQGQPALAALDAALARAEAEALRIETLIGAHDPAALAMLPVALADAVQAWQASRERLWYRAHNIARGLPETGAVRLPAATLQALQAEADSALAAAQALVEQLQVQAVAKADAALRHLVLVALLGAALLLGLSLGVVEPIARRVRRQQGLMARQAEQLARLALVAERTHNAVVITDAQRRITWANDAFSRVSGYALDEALGRKPAELLQTEATDPATVQRMRQAFDAGCGVRVALVNRSKAGRSYWLDIDIQPLHDERGALSGFIAVETDITEQVFQRQRLRALLDALPTGVVEQDASGTIIDANVAAEQVLGLTRDQLQGRSSVDPRWGTVHDDLSPYPGDQHPIARSLRDGISVRGDILGVLTPQGEQRWLLVNSEPLRNPTGQVHGAVACFVDITEKRAQRTLLQLALQAAQIGTWSWRSDTDRREWSAVSCRMLGYSEAEFAPLLPQWRELIHPDDRPEAEAALAAHLQRPAQPYRHDMRLRHQQGHWVWIQVVGSVVERDVIGGAQRMLGLHIDVSERKRHEAALQASALTDALTGLPNRSALMRSLRERVAAWRREPSRHFALMFLDFDRFKQVNDSLGHAAGDELLRQIAARLQATLRGNDLPGRAADALSHGPGPGMGRAASAAARLGGDEFVVLLSDLAAPGDATAVAERLLQVLAMPYEVCGHRVHSSASIGVVGSDQPFADADSLLRDADTAMYEAKQGGRGRWLRFEPQMHTQVAQRACIEADLHEALVRDELFVVYQPVLALDELDPAAGCAGVEALVRWRHPARGVVAPVQFIGVAEECGLIGALGHFVLQTACRQFMRWQLDLGARAPGLLAVNLSVAQLRQADLVDQVRAVLAANAMPAAALQLEVTESLASQDPSALARLRELKALGVKIALDDFGTGYSSLACLHRLPVDTVKIDRSFVAEAERSEYHRALIEATVRVARTLRMATVAEGVETAGQHALVRSLGCDRGQGWLYCRPDLPDALTVWLQARALPRRAATTAQPLMLVSGG